MARVTPRAELTPEQQYSRWLNDWRDYVLSPAGPRDPGEKLVAVALAKYVNKKERCTFVAANKIAKDCALSDKTTRKHMTALITNGWFSAETKRRGRDWEQRFFSPQYPPRAEEESSTAQPQAPEKSSGTQAQEVFADAAEVSSTSAGKQRPERRKNLPTNSYSEPLIEPGLGGPGARNDPLERERQIPKDRDSERAEIALQILRGLPHQQLAALYGHRGWTWEQTLEIAEQVRAGTFTKSVSIS